MDELPTLSTMKSEDKDALIIELWEKVKVLEAELAKQQKKVRKTSKNSSVPPSTDIKQNIDPHQHNQESSKSKHNFGGRQLSQAPNHIVSAYAQECCHCGHCLSPEDQQLQAHYDKIELPPIYPIVTQVKRYGGRCPSCNQYYIASVAPKLEQGSPFGDSIEAVVNYLRYTHAISYQRLSSLMSEIFNLQISAGALGNLFQRTKAKLTSTVSEIKQCLRDSNQVGSDETSARVSGKTQWEWVFQNKSVCYHIIRPSRGAKVIEEVMADSKPTIWVSDLFSAQAKHPAEQWQVCLAHQLRDCQYAMDKGDTIFSPVIRQVFLRAISIHNRRATLSPTTRYQYRCDIKRRLNHALELNPEQEDGIRLLKRYRKHQGNLFLFLEDDTIPTTNNTSEQAIRMSVIFRKVTNGFRSDWGRDLFADIRSVINTGKRQGLSALEAIQKALEPDSSLFLPR